MGRCPWTAVGEISGTVLEVDFGEEEGVNAGSEVRRMMTPLKERRVFQKLRDSAAVTVF